MKTLKRLGGFITNNLWLKILALFLAVLIWVLVAQINNPASTVTFSNIKVTLLNADTLENEGKVYQVLDRTDVVKVTVKAPESVIRTLTASDVTAVADLSEITPQGTVPIVYTLDRAENIVGDHDELLVSVEDKVTKYVNIQYVTNGSVGEGCVLGKVNLDRNRLEISGPRSDVDQVSYAMVVIDLDGAMKTISADMEITLVDDSGIKVDKDTISKQTDYVTTTVTVLSTKEVPIIASVTGIPSGGYLYVGDMEIFPETVSLAGDTATLNLIPYIEITDPVDITGARNDIIATFDLSNYLPSNASYEDPDLDDEISVTAKIYRTVEKTINIAPSIISITDLPSGFTAEAVGSDDISVRVVGLETDLNAITADSLSPSVDVAEYIEDAGLENIKEGDVLTIPVNLRVSENVTADDCFVRIILYKD